MVEVKLFGANDPPGIAWHAGPPTGDTRAACTITAVVKQATRGALVVETPPTKDLPRSTSLRFKLAADVRGVYETADPRRIDAGATVIECAVVRLNTGDVVVKSLVARNPATLAVGPKGDDALAARYQKLPDEPRRAPREVRSAHFAFKTDLSDREAAIVLDKLERMARLLEKQFRRPATGVVEEQPGVSFESVYGPVAKQISFEYDLFLATVGNGYRADLVAWPWKDCGKSRALVFRCSDAWTQLGDNSGEVVITVRRVAAP